MHVAARLVGYGYDSQKTEDDLGGDAPMKAGPVDFVIISLTVMAIVIAIVCVLPW